MKTLKKIGKIYGIFLLVYWSIAGIMALFSFGYDSFYAMDKTDLVEDLKRRFLPRYW